MTPEPALWKGRSRGPLSGGTSKKRRKKGSSSNGFCGPRSRIVPRVAMFTTAGDTFFTIGDKDGTGVSPTIAGMAAGADGAITAVARIAARARSARFMVDSGRTMPGKIPQRHQFYSGPGWATLCGITHSEGELGYGAGGWTHLANELPRRQE